MLRSQALSAIFNENLDTIAQAIFLTTISGHLIGTSSTNPSISPSLIKTAAVLSASTFAYYADKSSSSSSSNTRQESATRDSSSSETSTARPNGSAGSDRDVKYRQRNNRLDSTSRSTTQRSMSSETSDGAVFATGAHAGYLAIQPLMVVAQEEWSDEWISGYTGENGLLESRLRRIVVEVPVNKLLGAGDESRGSVGSVSRYCAVESIGQGLCIGVLGAEVQEIVSPRRARVSDEAESQDGEDNDDDDDEEDGGDASTDEEQALSVESDVIHDSQRRIRLLGIRTEALAEFMRKEFEGFKMPPTIMF